ncbi:uncharacterized protein LOC110162157 [Boleophthalmus pectinirostris]|uniref:uncharacterized protein LOC110162157 n=1 Tax=Boleophthalmus pectinirostris TaxID=150288 RepID=UPI00242D3DCA|nr:uncharacterized protein LOC110162157 [Boleophthalmus pectinirostris]
MHSPPCVHMSRGAGLLWPSSSELRPLPPQKFDLSYNHPGPSAELLTALQDQRPLLSVRLDPAGERWMVPGLRKYSCDVSLDSNSAHKLLLLSEDHQTVTHVKEEQEYPDHDDRFTDYVQVLSCTGLRGRCYWEVDWSRAVVVAVSYKKIRRRGQEQECGFGFNDHSWSLGIYEDGQYFVTHNGNVTRLQRSCHSERGGVFSGRVGVFLDSEAGALSFYDVSSDRELSHLWTFSSSFSEPLFPGFGLWDKEGSSVTLLKGPNMTERLKETHSPQKRPRCKISSPRLDPAGERWMVPGLRKYSCDVSLDPNSAHRRLLLSDDHRTVTHVEEEQEYPDHDDRFTDWPQVLSCTGLRGRCYWEVDWSGAVDIAVSYRKIRRSGEELECAFGFNDHSWSLRIYKDGQYFLTHNSNVTRLSRSCHSRRVGVSSGKGGVFFGRVGVFLDSEAGVLSFYDVSSDGELFLLWTFSSFFSEPLFPGFGLWDQGSSVTLLKGPNMTERLKETHSPQKRPRLKISSQRLDPAGERWMVPGLRKYSCDVSLDTNSAHRRLLLSDDHRTVTHVEEEQEYPDHDDRFTDRPQILSCTGLRGRCYWEVDWRGAVVVAVSYRKIRRKGRRRECVFGFNDHSWSLRIYEDGQYLVTHNSNITRLPRSCHSEREGVSSGKGGVFFGRVGVFLDSEAGALSFYDVSSDGELFHLWTFSSFFSEPLFPGFGLWAQGSSVTLLKGPNTTERLKETHSPQERPRLKISSPSVSKEPEARPSHHREPCDFVPDVRLESGFVCFRFRCPGSGAFRCSSTGLVFVVTKEAELQYRIVQWDEALVESSGRTPAGHLYDIECPEQAVCELHLPHCEPEHVDLSTVDLCVAHISDCGLSLMEPERITQSHVVISVSGLSVFGILMKFFGGYKEISGQVLLFCTTDKLTINMFLLPRNISLDQVKEKQDITKFRIDAPPKCKLVVNRHYRVTCPTAERVQPERALFDLDHEPNYYQSFQLHLPPNCGLLSISLTEDNRTENKENTENTEVWRHELNLTEVIVGEDQRPQVSPRVSPVQQLESVRSEFVQSVCLTRC